MSARARFVVYSGLVFVAAALVVLLVSSAARVVAAEEQGKAIFEQRCQFCHSIGGGRMVGPDLKDVSSRRDREWVLGFIVAPDAVIKQGDPIATQLVQEYGSEMPNLGLTLSDAQDVLAYIDTFSGAEPSPAPEPTLVSAPETSEISADSNTGRDIFTGRQPLQNGGTACLSCHNVDGIAALGGGSMGNDLTLAYSTFNEAGLSSILKSTPYPVMREAYLNKPLTDEEIADLIAFLRDAGSAQQKASSSPAVFIIIGIAGFLVILGIFQLVWRRRLSGVRQLLVKGGPK